MRSKGFFQFDPSDHASMCRLMDERGSGLSLFCGLNDDGERITVLVSPDAVEVSTLQDNGWFRVNTYHRDGTREETYRKN